jgi:hypothetical protein
MAAIPGCRFLFGRNEKSGLPDFSSVHGRLSAMIYLHGFSTIVLNRKEHINQ